MFADLSLDHSVLKDVISKKAGALYQQRELTKQIVMENDLPPGLLISKSTKIKSLNLNDGDGNFYLKPKGIFSVSKKVVVKIQITSDFDDNEEKTFALQSGPMLIYKNQISNSFQTNSNNFNIRSAVGISKDELIFVISKSKVSFYQLADFMKNTLYCKMHYILRVQILHF